MLACGDINLTAGDQAIILYVLGSWVIGIVLFVINIYFILDLRISRRFKAANIGFLLIYTFLTLTLYSAFSGDSWKIYSNSSWVVPVMIFGIPIMVASHFVFLFCVQRRLKKLKDVPDTISKSS